MSRPLTGPALIAGGRGAVGALLAREFISAGIDVTVLDLNTDPRMTGGEHLVGNILEPDTKTDTALRAAAIVVLAVPEDVALKAVPMILPRLAPGALLVDTLSVKTPYAAALSEFNGSWELLGINPMFAPDLGFAGRSVIAVPYLSGERSAALLQFITDQGANLVVMDTDAHDHACAMLQAATHAAILAFGLALRGANYDHGALETVAPPPHRALLALLARILDAEPEVYRDIQAANPYAAEMRKRMGHALHELDAVVATGDPASFARLLDGLKPVLGDRLDDYARTCAALFSSAEMKR